MRVHANGIRQQTGVLRSQLPSDERRLPIDFSIDLIAVGHVHRGHRRFTIEVPNKFFFFKKKKK